MYLRYCSDDQHAVTDLRPVAAAANTIVNHPPINGPPGIDPKLLDSFPIIVYSILKDYKLGSNIVQQLECAVCLIEFKHDDMLRLLPKCNHVFHPGCINVWLASHVTCPVCRSVLKPAEEVAVVIRSHEANDVPEEVGDMSARQTAATSTMEVSSGERGLRRCHSTGHSLDLDEWRGRRDMEMYSLRLTEEARREVMVNHGGVLGSSPMNCDVFQGRHEGEGSSQGRLILSDLSQLVMCLRLRLPLLFSLRFYILSSFKPILRRRERERKDEF